MCFKIVDEVTLSRAPQCVEALSPVFFYSFFDSLLRGIQFFKGRLRKDTPLSAEADTSPTGGEVELRSIP